MKFKKINKLDSKHEKTELIIVTGLGRSRTSLTMDYLYHLEYKPYYTKSMSKPDIYNINGYFEHEKLTAPRILKNIPEIGKFSIETYILNYKSIFKSLMKISEYQHFNEFIKINKKVCLKSFCFNIMPVFSFFVDSIKIIFLYRKNFIKWKESQIKKIKAHDNLNNNNPIFNKWYSDLTSDNLSNIWKIRKNTFNYMEKVNILTQIICEQNNIEYDFHILSYEDFDDNIDLINKKILDITGKNKDIDSIKDLYKKIIS
ncbi:MAG: hypothetical protein ACOCV1_02450 [Bacillota bacterium]